MADNKYLISVSFRAVVEAENETDALYSIGGAIKYGFNAASVENVSTRIIRKEEDSRTPEPVATVEGPGATAVEAPAAEPEMPF